MASDSEPRVAVEKELQTIETQPVADDRTQPVADDRNTTSCSLACFRAIYEGCRKIYRGNRGA